MSDSITQTRLSMRLDAYLSEYTRKNVGNNNLHKKEWDASWKIADLARIDSNLTPEIVDNVRIALHEL
ncbi:MAG TPA: hypothetical protein VGD98_07620 [Ktedonobacteraceae bacterium]